MRPFEPILTERLLLRRLAPGDAADLFRYRNHPEVTRFQSLRLDSEAAALAFIQGLPARPGEPDTWFQLALCLRSDGRLIGDVGIHFLDDHGQAGIGYTLDPEHQGQGYAREAVAALLAYLFGELGFHRVTASIDPANTKSLALVRNLGMRQEATFLQNVWNGTYWEDECIYALLRDEWEKRAAKPRI